MVNDPQPATAPQRARRPFGVTLVAVGVLSIASLNLLRFMLAINLHEFVDSLPTALPYYQAISGFIWAVIGLTLFWALWRGFNWAGRLTLGFTVAYALYYWLDRLVIARGVVTGDNWFLPASVTAALIAYNFLALSNLKARAFFSNR
jgi:hypothetical protein